MKIHSIVMRVSAAIPGGGGGGVTPGHPGTFAKTA